MTTQEFLYNHNAAPEQIHAEESLAALLEDMEHGLSGEGNIPMLPSYLSPAISVPAGEHCCVLDAGGTNLRTARATFDENGTCHLEHLVRQPMPGTEGTLSFEEFYDMLAAPVRRLGHYERVGFCFSYNTTMGRDLDGTLDFWCKEVQVPEAVGHPVGASLQAALGEGCSRVHVLNDSVAAMLGVKDVQAGIILGTGINVCYTEQCCKIPKIRETLNADAMIVSTEVGEFSRIPKSDFEQAVIVASDAPNNAQAEKQCAGGYLGGIITCAWNTAALEGLLPPSFRNGHWNLAQISEYLTEGAGSPIAYHPDAVEIARATIRRAAKIAAILCAGPLLRISGHQNPLRVAMEGSQYWKLTGFRDAFHRELDALLRPWGIAYEIIKTENACLIGAARAAFAEKM